MLLYVLFLAVLSMRALMHARSGGFVVGVQAMCLLLYIQIYDLANVSTIPITRFGFFMMAVASACLSLVAASNTREAGTARLEG